MVSLNLVLDTPRTGARRTFARTTRPSFRPFSRGLIFKDFLDFQQGLFYPLQGRIEPVENADDDEKPEHKEYGIRVDCYRLP